MFGVSSSELQSKDSKDLNHAESMAVQLESMGLSLGSLPEDQQKSLETTLPIVKMLKSDASISCKRTEAMLKLTLANMKEFRQKWKLESELQSLNCKSKEVSAMINVLETDLDIHSENKAIDSEKLNVENNANILREINSQGASLFRIFDLIERIEKKREEVNKLRDWRSKLQNIPPNLMDVQDLIVEKRKRLEYLKGLL